MPVGGVWFHYRCILMLHIAIGAFAPNTFTGSCGDKQFSFTSDCHAGRLDVDSQSLLQTASRTERKAIRRTQIESMLPAAQASRPIQPGCHALLRASKGSDLYESCPKDCPLWAMARTLHSASSKCDFLCVEDTASSCHAVNPLQPIPDRRRGVCRSCKVPGCERCDPKGTDKCDECGLGFFLHDGSCKSKMLVLCYVVGSVGIALVTVVVVGLLRLECLEHSNAEVLRQGLAARSREKLHMPKKSVVWPEAPSSSTSTETSVIERESTGLPGSFSSSFLSNIALPVRSPGKEPSSPATVRYLWPLTTNLLRQEIAGPGIMLHFNFQLAVIVWSFLMLLAWLLFALVVDTSFLTLGRTFQDETPRQNCIMNAQGHAREQRLMAMKACFTLCAYLGSFCLALMFSVHQLRTFQRCTGRHVRGVTHGGFCATVTGLPIVKGDVLLEEELQSFFEKEFSMASGENSLNSVEGVSVCWDFRCDEGLLMDRIKLELGDLQKEFEESRQDSSESIDAVLSPSGLYSRRRLLQTFVRKSLLKGGAGRTSLPPIPDSFTVPASGSKIPPRRIPIREDDDESRSQMGTFEKIILSHWTQDLMTRGRARRRRHLQRSVKNHSPAYDMDDEDMCSKLETLKTTGQAFVVFRTPTARDDAVAKVNNKRCCGEALQFRESVLQFEATTCEPDTVIWSNLHELRAWGTFRQICIGVLFIILALAAWLALSFIPWAWWEMSQMSRAAQPSSMFAGYMFPMIVAAGNAIMYKVCAWVSDYVSFAYIDTRETCYLLLYNFAVTVNVILDMSVTMFAAQRTLREVDMPTFDGFSVRDIENPIYMFHTYVMQSTLANQLYVYCFPATFLLPFILEPLVTIYLPYKIACLIIRTHPEITREKAESYLASAPYDLSRYSDVIVNLSLAVTVFFFVGGNVAPIFALLFFCHSYIYVYDHYRVLRSIPKCDFASMEVDWWAQWMLSGPCGLLLACSAYKYNLSSCARGDLCVSSDWSLLLLVGGLFILHVVLHSVLLLFMVPCLGRREPVTSKEATYKNCAQKIAASWFNCNPVHCLRSQYIYNHDPPWIYCMPGKEHLLKKNETIGAYFEDQFEAEVEPQTCDGEFEGVMSANDSTEIRKVLHSSSNFLRHKSSSLLRGLLRAGSELEGESDERSLTRARSEPAGKPSTLRPE